VRATWGGENSLWVYPGQGKCKKCVKQCTVTVYYLSIVTLFLTIYPANGSCRPSSLPTSIYQMKMDADLQNNTTRRLINETHGTIYADLSI
jgi:hypothetical protein